MPVDKLVINREQWGMGKLLNEDGTMCCLGHLSRACGVPKQALEIKNRTNCTWLGLPNEEWVEVNEWARKGPNGDVKIATDINDDAGMSWAEKEKRLISVFARNGIALSFKGPSKDQ